MLLEMIIFSVSTTFVIFFWQPVISQDFKDHFFQAYTQCDKEIKAIFIEKSFSSILTPNDYKRIAEIQKKYLIPLGTRALPYLIVLSQEGKWWLTMALHENWGGHSGAIFGISKFRPHVIKLSQTYPKKFTTEEFYEIVEIMPNEYKIFLFWLLEGRQRTPQWFRCVIQSGWQPESKAMFKRLKRYSKDF